MLQDSRSMTGISVSGRVAGGDNGLSLSGEYKLNSSGDEEIVMGESGESAFRGE